MANLQIRCFGFTDADYQQLQAFIAKYSSRKHRWQVRRSGKADLNLFDVDNSEGSAAWRQHDNNILNIRCSRRQSTSDNLLQMKLPMSEGSLFAMLAFAERHLYSQNNLNNRFHFLQASAKGISPRLFTVWLTQKRFWSRLSPAQDLPAISLLKSSVSTHAFGDIITDPDLLKLWLSQLTDEPTQRTTILMSNLLAIKQQDISESRQLSLLELYYQEVCRLLLKVKPTAVNNSQPATQQKLEINLSQTLRCLAEIYFALADKYYQRGERPDRQNRYLFSLNRGSELVSLQILHAYSVYREAPAGCWLQLNQLLNYLEKADALQLQAQLTAIGTSRSFDQIYKLIALLAIADPFRLPKYAAMKLYKMFLESTDKVIISAIPLQQQAMQNAFLLTGFFCIDLQADHGPKALAKTPQLLREQPDKRMLQTQDLLTVLGQRLILNMHRDNQLEIRLIRQIMPQLAANYQRQSSRKKALQQDQIDLINGFANIVRFFEDGSYQRFKAQVSNYSDQGLLLASDNFGQSVAIHDLLLLNTTPKPQLATINWLCKDWYNAAQTGIHLLEGTPEMVICRSVTVKQNYVALKLPGSKPTLLTPKGVYSPQRKLLILDKAGISISIETKDLLFTTLDYDHFSYIILAGS